MIYKHSKLGQTDLVLGL